jgi:hypothetical protein
LNLTPLDEVTVGKLEKYLPRLEGIGIIQTQQSGPIQTPPGIGIDMLVRPDEVT